VSVGRLDELNEQSLFVEGARSEARWFVHGSTPN
jgi:hypothetical protein